MKTALITGTTGQRENGQVFKLTVSRTALQGLPIKDRDNDFLLGLIKKLSQLYFVDVLGFALMGNSPGNPHVPRI